MRRTLRPGAEADADADAGAGAGADLVLGAFAGREEGAVEVFWRLGAAEAVFCEGLGRFILAARAAVCAEIACAAPYADK